MLFGLEIGFLAVLAITLIITYGVFMSESAIGAAVVVVLLGGATYYANYISFIEFLVYMGIYIVIGASWATYRLIKDVRRDYETRSKDYKERGKNKSQKEILSEVLDNVSYQKFVYRLSFVFLDMVTYLFSDLLKDLFLAIKKSIRSYLFKSILGEKEETVY